MTLRDNIIYAFISTLMWALGYIPPSIGKFVGDLMGSFWFLIDKKHRNLTCRNLNQAFGDEKTEKEIKKMAKAVFQNTAGMLFEHTRFHITKRETWHEVFTITGLEHIEAAKKKGKGILLFSAHLGNWELLASLVYFAKINVAVVYKTVEFPPLNKYITKKREFTGAKMFPVHNALDEIVKSLEKGNAAGLIIDQNVRKRNRGVFIDFFNRKACATNGLARLALSTKAPVIPTFTYKDKGKRHMLVLPEMPLIETGNPEQDIIDNTQAYHSLIEKYVRKYPEQYFWIHNRWKTRPLDEIEKK